MSLVRPMRSTVLAAILLTAAWCAHADDSPNFDLVIRNSRFVPDRLEVPANTRFRLTVKNEDSGAEEFESSDLKKEKVIAPGAKVTLTVIPLKPGSYRFYGEFHPETAQGVIVAR